MRKIFLEVDVFFVFIFVNEDLLLQEIAVVLEVHEVFSSSLVLPSASRLVETGGATKDVRVAAGNYSWGRPRLTRG